MKPWTLSLFMQVHNHMARQVKYKLGAEVQDLDCDTSLIELLDCSEYVQVQGAHQGISIPDGTGSQFKWFAKQGCAPKLLRNVITKADDSRLFVAGWEPDGHPYGHVFFVRGGGKTYECAKKLDGVGSQSARVYLGHKGLLCFELPVAK